MIPILSIMKTVCLVPDVIEFVRLLVFFGGGVVTDPLTCTLHLQLLIWLECIGEHERRMFENFCFDFLGCSCFSIIVKSASRSKTISPMNWVIELIRKSRCLKTSAFVKRFKSLKLIFWNIWNKQWQHSVRSHTYSLQLQYPGFFRC